MNVPYAPAGSSLLRFYVEVARTAYRRQLIYRWANIAGLCTNAFFGAIGSYVVVALFQVRASVGGYHLADTVQYIWLLQALTMPVLPFGWMDLMLTIRTGDVVSDLSKPCDFYWYWAGREAGRTLYYLAFRAVPTYVLGMVLFAIGLPAQADRWLLFLASLVLAATLGIAYRFLYNLVAFWVVEARAVATMAHSIALFCTGMIIPVAFFPPSLRAITAWLPFNGLMNLPAEFFLGKVPGSQIAFELARQLAWVLALTLIARRVAASAARRVVAQGG
jgi:ABC-2 type transport system permease protein